MGYERSLIKPTGRTIAHEWAHVYTLRDGKIARARFIEDTEAYVVAFDAAESMEVPGGVSLNNARSREAPDR